MFDKIARTYLKIVEFVCVVLLMMIMGCMCIQIGCRLLTIGQSFTEELSRICFCLLVFIGMPLAYAEGADIAVDMLVNVLPAFCRRLVDIIVHILTAVFSVFCMRSLVTFIGSNNGVTAVSMTWIKMNWIYYACMFSFGCLFVTAVIKLIAAVTGRSQVMDINAEAKEKAKLEEKEMDLGI